MSDSIGPIQSIAIRTARRGPMKEIASARAEQGGGIDADLHVSPDRGITFLAAGAWRQTCAALQADLPWHTRRANVLIDADSIADLIGRTIRFGDVTVEIKGETHPCGLMDELHAGLRAALTPDVRAGVLGRVVTGGTFAVGDTVTYAD